MSKFRLLAEDVLNTVKNEQPLQYQYLTPELQQALSQWVNTGIEVDPEELSSATWDNNPYDVEPELRGNSGDWVYDEKEMNNAVLEKAIEYLRADGIENYIDETLLPKGVFEPDYDEALAQKVTNEAIDFLEKQITL